MKTVLCFFILMASCNHKIEKELAAPPPFRKWLNDTLIVLKDAKNINQFPRQIFVMPDSSNLSIRQDYDFETDGRTNIEDGHSTNLIWLLNEYQELPDHPFHLRFQTNHNYTPSGAEDMIRDEQFEYSTIEITDQQRQTFTIYSYIRGRLGYKLVKRLNAPDSEKAEWIDFKHQDGKLIKEKR